MADKCWGSYWHRRPFHSSNHHRRHSEETNEAWRVGANRRWDHDLERSRENALMSVRMYLRQDEFKSSQDHQVRSPSRHFRRTNPETTMSSFNYGEGKGFLTGKTVRDSEQWNSRPGTEEDSETVRKGSDAVIVDEDDELEEGQLTPSSRSSLRQEERGSDSMSSCRMNTESNESESMSQSLVSSRENSCANDLTPSFKKRKKTVNKKKRKQRETESHTIAVCGNGRNRGSSSGSAQQKLVSKGRDGSLPEKIIPCKEDGDERKKMSYGELSEEKLAKSFNEDGKKREVTDWTHGGWASKVGVTDGNKEQVISHFKENDNIESDILPRQEYLSNVKSLGVVSSLVSCPELNFGLGLPEAAKYETERLTCGSEYGGVPDRYAHLNRDLVPPFGFSKMVSGTSECVVPFHRFAPLRKDFSPQLEDGGEKRKLGKPWFTEATVVSSLCPLTSTVKNSTVISNHHGTIPDAKQVGGKLIASNSDSSMPNLNAGQLDHRGCTTSSRETNVWTALETVQLNNRKLSCMKTSSKYIIDQFDIHEMPYKKLKLRRHEGSKTIFTHGYQRPNSYGPLATTEKTPGLISKSNLPQQSSICQVQGIQHKNDISKNSVEKPLTSKPLTASSQIRPKPAGGLFNRVQTWTWKRNDNLVEPAAKISNASSSIQAQLKVDGLQTSAYIRRGNSLVRASGPPMSSHNKKWGASGRPWSDQHEPLKSFCAINLSPRKDVTKTVPSTIKSVVSTIESNMKGFVHSGVSHLPCNTTSQASGTVSSLSSADTRMMVTSLKAETLHPTLSVINSFSIHDGDSQAQGSCTVGSHVTSIPSNCTLLGENSQNEDKLLDSKSKATAQVKEKSTQFPSGPTCVSEPSMCFMNKSSELQLDIFEPDYHDKRNDYGRLQDNKPVEENNTSISDQNSFPNLSRKLRMSASKNKINSRAFLTKLGRVLKQKKWAISLCSQVWNLDTGHPQSQRLPLFQTNKIVRLCLPWKRSVSEVAYSRKRNVAAEVNKTLSCFHISKKLWCLKNRQAPFSRSVDGLSLCQSTFSCLGGSELKWDKLIPKIPEKDGDAITTLISVEKAIRGNEDNVAGDVDANEHENKLVSYNPFEDLKLHSHGGSSCDNRVSHVRCTTDSTRTSASRKLPSSGAKYVHDRKWSQFVKNPKKISLALASDKVRWSLHTVRSTLCKKQQYCKFFTRFGKCNKEVGRCPYNHDSEKVPICQRFLKATCFDMDCRLTHKVIPEQMSDCSAFLLGICTHENCPYRHVNVSSKAPVCDEFPSGFCVDGDKCNKKHTYICPQYASTGNCSERPICKLHHPKKKIKSRLSPNEYKRPSKDRKCYPVTLKDLGHIQSTSSLMKQRTGVNEDSMEDGTAAYISLSTTQEDTSEDCPLGLPTDDLDRLFKPVLLLRQKV